MARPKKNQLAVKKTREEVFSNLFAPELGESLLEVDQPFIDDARKLNPKAEIVFGYCPNSPVFVDTDGKHNEFHAFLSEDFKDRYSLEFNSKSVINKFIKSLRSFYSFFGVFFELNGESYPEVGADGIIYYDYTHRIYSPIKNAVGEFDFILEWEDKRNLISKDSSTIIDAVSSVNMNFAQKAHEKLVFRESSMSSSNFRTCCDVIYHWTEMNSLLYKNKMAGDEQLALDFLDMNVAVENSLTKKAKIAKVNSSNNA